MNFLKIIGYIFSPQIMTMTGVVSNVILIHWDSIHLNLSMRML